MPAALRVRLVDLPDDILLLLAELLSDTTINRLLQTCRRLRDALEHALYVRNARERNSSALQWAAYCGVMGSVKKALAAGADPNATRRRSGNLRPDNFAFDIYSSSILRNLPFSASLAAAAATGRLVIASVLIEAGALVDVRAHGFDSMPLVVAIQNGHLDMIKLLVASGKIDINSRFFLQRDCNLLNFAIPQASVEVVRYLLATIKRPDAGPDDWTTPLISAIRSNRVSVVRTLVESAKIDINKPDADGRTPFIWAVRLATKYPTMAQLLLDSEEVDVNAVDRTGRTALSWAAGLGNESMVQFLLETLDVDPNLADAQGTPPITHALKVGEISVVKLLMASDKVRTDASTLFRIACQHKSTDIIEKLLELDCIEQRTTDEIGSTWLHTAATYGCTATVKRLIRQQRMDINQQRLDGATPLICALQEKQRATITVLLRAGADVNMTTTEGRSALFYAAQSSSETLSEELLKRGAKVGAVTITGDTALHHACRNGMNKVVQVLLNYGADPVLRASHGGTPLHAACLARWEQTVRMLLGVIPRSHPILRTGRTPLHDACQAGHTGIAKQLVDHGADPLARLDDGTTPLEYACSGFPLIAKMLLEKGADPLQTSSAGVSLLYLACKNGTPKVATLLLQHGANPNAVEIDGTTPFLKACQCGNVTVIRALLKYGADVTSTHYNGFTALHEICRGGTDECGLETVIKAMVEKGANFNASTQDGLTPLHVACQNGRLGLVMPLVEAGADTLAEHVDILTSRRTTPIHLACRFPPDTAALNILLRARSKVPITEFWKSGWTPLHEAAAGAHSAAVCLLLQNDVNPMLLADDGSTALHQILKHPRLGRTLFQKWASQIISTLMGTGKMDINHRDNEGRTALGLADDAPESLRILMVKWGAKK